MSDERRPQEAREKSEPEFTGHPKGTLAIVGIYGLLFLAGWLVLYFFVFVPRGPLTR